MNATPKQRFMLFTKCGVDIRNVSLTLDEAKGFIELALNGFADDVQKLLIGRGGIPRGKTKAPDTKWSELHEKADKAGKEAANACTPTPMIVSGEGREYYVPSGVCGFAWISIRPANCAFANWLRKNNIGRTNSYEGGLQIWVSDYGQSMELKEAYARGYAKVIKEAGIRAYSGSRMD